MIDGLKPYPKMKDAGVPWLGPVPDHWQILPPKRVLRSCSSGSAPIKNTASAEPREGFVPAFSASGQDVWLPQPMFHGPGLVLSAVGARCGKTFRADGAWAVVANTHVLLAREGHRDFWWYVTNDEDWWERSGAAQPFVQVTKTLDRPWAVPPATEQAAIVRFLDHADRRIRRYIRAKQKLIKLLEEQKQAIIHCAVTRGLNPNVRLKPSGVEWLGEVPEHWEVVRLKIVASHIADCLHATPTYTEGGQFPAIRTADITPGAVHLRTARRVDDRTYERWTERLEPAAGDILYSREGERFGIAACVPPDTRLCISQRMMVFRIRPEHNSSFVMWALNSPQAYAQATQDVMGSTAPHVNVSTIRNFVLALPSLDEQCQIVGHIESATLGIDRTIEHAVREIQLLREYRTRLIADVVTGKLDVREAAARLPDDVEEPEALDSLGMVYETEEDCGNETTVVPEEAEA